FCRSKFHRAALIGRTLMGWRALCSHYDCPAAYRHRTIATQGNQTPHATAGLYRADALLCGSWYRYCSGCGFRVANAAIRMENLSHFLSPYGLMVMLKAALTIVLGLIGFGHRVRVIPQLKTGT